MQREVRCEDDSSTDCIEVTVKYLPGVLSPEVHQSAPAQLFCRTHLPATLQPGRRADCVSVTTVKYTSLIN